MSPHMRGPHKNIKNWEVLLGPGAVAGNHCLRETNVLPGIRCVSVFGRDAVTISTKAFDALQGIDKR